MTSLTPEEQRAANEKLTECSRRDFIKGGVLAAAVPAVGLGAFYFGYSKVHGSPVRVGFMGTGDEGSVLLGALNPDYVDLRSIADIRPYNLHRAFYGDHENENALKVRPGICSVYGWKNETEAKKHLNVYGDYNDLLANAKADGLEAVIIALPLHLHAPATVKALKLGLHVLTEKLMGHSVTQCKEMSMAAKEAHRHLATGHQRHYNVLYAEAVDNIRRGLLGNIHYIRAQWHRDNRPGIEKDSWRQPMPRSLKTTDDMASRLERARNELRKELQTATGSQIEKIAAKLAQKEAQIADEILLKGGHLSGDRFEEIEFKTSKDYGYEDAVFGSGEQEYRRPASEELLRWRLWERTGGGLMVELGSHQLDAASIFLAANNDYYLDSQTPGSAKGDKIHPLKVHVSASRNLFGLDREVSDHITTLVEFPAPDYDPKSVAGSKRKICVQYSAVNGNGYGGYGEIVYGTKGTMILEREADIQLARSDAKTTKVAASGAAELDTQSSGPAQKLVAGAKAEVSRGYKEQIEHWAWCIRENPNNSDPKLQPRCYPKIALGDAVIALVTNMAAAKGNSIAFKEEWFDPENPATPETDELGDPNGVPSLSKEIYKS